MNRTQLTLGGLLLLQILLVAAFRSPFGAAAASVESQPLLPALADMAPTRLELEGTGKSEGEGAGEKIALVKSEGRWRLEEAGDIPADDKKVNELIESLKKIKIRRPVVSSGRYHEAFRVEDDEHEGRVRLWSDGASEPGVDLILGSSPNYRTTHVRVAGQDAVYEVRGIASYDTRPDRASWLDKEIVGVTADQVVSLRLTNAQGTFELARVDDQWKVVEPASAAGALDADKVSELLRTVTSLRLADAAGALDEAAQGLATPAATVVVRFKPEGAGEDAGPQELTLRIGGKVSDDDAKRYVSRSGSGFAGEVWDSSVSSLVEQRLEALSPS